MPLDLVLLGAPGAGKGTQAQRIVGGYGIPQISTGDILRAAVAAGSALGERVRPIMESGQLVPDDLIVDLIRERLAEPDTAGGCIFDGFPRTIPQAQALDEMLPEIGRRITSALFFDLPDEEAKRRMLGRAEQEGRADDTPEVIEERMRVYHEKTAPLLSHYRDSSVLVRIDAGGTVDEVYAQVTAVLGAPGEGVSP
jgi:adenylate kinase